MNEKDKARFWSKVARAGEDECWLWLAGKDHGYGVFRVGGVTRRAHVVALELVSGYNELCVLHSCNNPACVNPKHLRYGTHKDNMEDKKTSNRCNSPQGEKHGRAVLTSAQVDYIRSTNETVKDVAKHLGISSVHVRRIQRHLNWRD